MATNVVNPMLPAPSPSHHHVDGWDFNHLQTVTLWHWTALYMLSLLETNKDVENSPFVDHVPCDLCSPIGFSTSFWSSLPQGLHCSSGTKENKLAGGGRQVDAASMFDAYAHPTISTLALDWGQDCGENGRCSWGDLHGCQTLKTSISWDINFLKQDETRTHIVYIVISIEYYHFFGMFPSAIPFLGIGQHFQTHPYFTRIY